MSRRGSEGGSDKKTPLDIYVALMMVSTSALIIGTTLLALSIAEQYNWTMP